MSSAISRAFLVRACLLQTHEMLAIRCSKRQQSRCCGRDYRSDKNWPGWSAVSASLPKRIRPAAA